MSLWSSEQNLVLLSMECFALLNEEASLVMTLDGNNQIHPPPLYTVYYKFGHESQQVTTGRAALQKRVMVILRQVNVATAGNLEVCDTHLNKAIFISFYVLCQLLRKVLLPSFILIPEVC